MGKGAIGELVVERVLSNGCVSTLISESSITHPVKASWKCVMHALSWKVPNTDRGCGQTPIQGIKVCRILFLFLLASYELGEE
jgi:hypothetical protein